MSGYLFLAATNGATAYSLNKQAQAKKRSQRLDDARSISNRSSLSSRSSMSSSRASIHSSKKPHQPRTKKKFDMNTSTYVTVVESPYERRLQKYEQKYYKLYKECQNHQQNEFLSRYRLGDGELLFTEDNLNILRYTFFKQITNDYEKISEDMSRKQNGQYKLKYMRRLLEIKQRQKSSIRGLPSLSAENLLDDNSGDTVDESEELDESDDESPKESYPGTEEYTYKPNLMINLKPTLSIKDLIKSNQLWNDVYQDLKFNLMEFSRNVNYFELLPNLNQLVTFYKEAIEYFLMNIECLSCNLNDLSEEEYEDLITCKFHYLKDFCYEWFKIMSNTHFKLFNDQSVLNSNINMYHDNNFTTHKQLLKRIIDTIMENLRNSIPEANKLNDVLTLWEGFFNFIVFEMIVKNYNTHNLNELSVTDHLPEPNLDGAGSLRSFNSASNQSLDHSMTTYGTSDHSFDDPLNRPKSMSSFNDDVHDLSRRTRNLTINTKPNLSPICRIDEESATDEIEFNYKRSGFVIEPPTPLFPEHDLTTPTSTTFSTFSDSDTKLYTSKRLIFSKFRKNKH